MPKASSLLEPRETHYVFIDLWLSEGEKPIPDMNMWKRSVKKHAVGLSLGPWIFSRDQGAYCETQGRWELFVNAYENGFPPFPEEAQIFGNVFANTTEEYPFESKKGTNLWQNLDGVFYDTVHLTSSDRACMKGSEKLMCGHLQLAGLEGSIDFTEMPVLANSAAGRHVKLSFYRTNGIPFADPAFWNYLKKIRSDRIGIKVFWSDGFKELNLDAYHALLSRFGNIHIIFRYASLPPGFLELQGITLNDLGHGDELWRLWPAEYLYETNIKKDGSSLLIDSDRPPFRKADLLSQRVPHIRKRPRNYEEPGYSALLRW